MNTITSTKWYRLPVDQVMAALKTSREGLTVTEVETRFKEYGPNKLPAKKPTTVWIIFFRQFLNPLIYILLIAGFVSFFIGEQTDALFIFAVILLNALLGTFQEWKAEKSAEALQNLLKITALVIRNGTRQEVDAEALVVGDVVFLESGLTVPADIRLYEANNLSIDEAVLTGESVACNKANVLISEEDVPISSQINMAFAGTTVMTGRGTGVVVATGLNTEIGKIAKSVAHTPITKTPLITRMEHFSKQISSIYVVGCVVLALVALARGMPGNEVFFMAVALAVASVPEGLPVALTIALSIASQRMAKRHVIVRKLTAVEGLGSCTCIASDKTGTLTVNRQTVRKIALPNGKWFGVTGEGYTDEGEVQTETGAALSQPDQALILNLAQAGILCNEATLRKENDQWVHQGDAVDLALLVLGQKMGLDAEAYRCEWRIVGKVPYESEKRYAAIFYRKADQTEGVFKGAVETILPFCKTVMTDEGVKPFDRQTIETEAELLAQDGYRVIAIAQGVVDENLATSPALNTDQIKSLSLLGFVGLIDPLRPEAKQSVQTCHQAGIRVVMVTGDHPETAFTIAWELGVAASKEEIITGAQLEALDDPDSPQLIEAISKVKVFARVAPLQKLYIVETLRKLGHFVAVTGDGVNDAPALKAANIGVAMGSGTDVAKNTASIIVADDNFASIVAGVEEGRFAYDNVRKVIYLLISTGASEVALFALSLIFNMPLPLTAVQLLWLNLVTDGIQDIALAFEGGEPGAMNRPPRSPQEGIFNRQMIEQTILSGVTMGLVAFLAWTGWQVLGGRTEFEARNLVLLLMVQLENFHVFNCRSETLSAFKVPIRRNLWIVLAAIAAQGIHIGAMYLPGMQKVLEIGPIRPYEWICHFLMAASVLIVMEIYKRYKNRSASQVAIHSNQTGD